MKSYVHGHLHLTIFLTFIPTETIIVPIFRSFILIKLITMPFIFSLFPTLHLLVSASYHHATNHSSCLNPTCQLGLILNSSITVYTRRLMTTFLKECVLCNKSSRNGRMELTETLALCMINTEEAFVRIVMGKKTCTNVLMSHLRGSKRPQLHHFQA